MGVTISYSGRAKDNKAVDRIMHTVSNAAAEWDWPCAQIDDPDGEIIRTLRKPGDPQSTPAEASGIDSVDADDLESSGVEVYEGPVRILVAQPGEGCEPLRLMFDKEHRMDGFTKTQYGPVEAHVRICRLLRAVERYFEVLEVYDDSEYWTTEDRAALEERIGNNHHTEEWWHAQIEAAKRKKALEDMYKIDGDDNPEP